MSYVVVQMLNDKIIVEVDIDEKPEKKLSTFSVKYTNASRRYSYDYMIEFFIWEIFLSKVESE